MRENLTKKKEIADRLLSLAEIGAILRLTNKVDLPPRFQVFNH